MFGKSFGTARDYHELNAGAHRKPPKVLSAPALVWHLAFWTNLQDLDQKDLNQKDLNQKDDLDQKDLSQNEVGQNGNVPDRDAGWPKKRRPAEIKSAIDRFIVTLCTRLISNEFVEDIAAGANDIAAKVRLTPFVDGAYLLFANAYSFGNDALARVCVKSLGARQSDIFLSTSRMVTLQFVWRKLDVTVRFEARTEYFTVSTFVELDRHRRKISSGIPELNENIASIAKYLNNRGLSVDESENLEQSINRYSFHEFWETYHREILAHDDLAAYAKETVFNHIIADFRGFIVSDQAVEFRDDDFFKKNKPAKWGWEAKRKFLPLIQHRKRTDHTRYECAVNYMLDGRALYMSTLGPQLPAVPEEERVPVEFIVYAHQRANRVTVVNKWQLGRIVSLILDLGTLRLCALKDVKLLHDAGRSLGALEESTQKARDAIALSEGNGAGVAGESDAALRNVEAMKQIADAHRKLNDITRRFLEGTGNGLSYRIERSRYYVQQFDASVKLLRIQRLEGDQPYDQFIRRRLGSEFDFINRLGIRYERATTSIVTLDQNYLAITQNALVEQGTRIDRDTFSIETSIKEIQEWGEFALLAALVPYYLMHLLDLMIAEKHIPGLTARVWTVFFALALYRKFKKWSYVLVFLGLALLVLVGVPGLNLADEGSILRAPESQSDVGQEILKIQRELKQIANEQVTLLKDLSSSIKRPDEPKPDSLAPASPEPTAPEPRR